MRYARHALRAVLLAAWRVVWNTLTVVWLAAVAALTVWLLAELVLFATGNAGLAERVVELAG